MTALAGPRRALGGRAGQAGRWAAQVAAAEVSLPVRVLSWVVGGLAALGLWLVVFALVLSALVESHAQHSLYNRFRAELAAGVAPVGDAVAQGTPVALLQSGRAGLDGAVGVQGVSSTALRLGPGHLPGTPLPGQAGTSAFYGRATSFGAPFAHVADLRAGDRVTVTTGQGRFRFSVTDVRRAGDRPAAAFLTATSRLVLVTSEGVGWRSGWAPSRAVFVDAVLVGTPAASVGVYGVRTSADGLLVGDTRGLYPMVLWLQLLLVAVVGGVWLRRRWGVWQAWTAATPVAVAGLWGATTSLWLLLPNLF